MASSLVLTLCVVLMTFGYDPSSFVEGQCLSHNDDAQTPPDTDLSGIQDFNFDLFKEVMPSDPKKNLIFSPYSVWNSLVLAYFGSNGETERQFQQVLRVQDKITTLRKWRHLETQYYMRPDTSKLNTFVLSNRAYFDTSVILRRCIQDILHNEVRQLDFMNDPRSAADSVNQFVSETTRGHINQLVSPMDVAMSHMVLVNAAYFKGTWLSPFDSQFTKDTPFRTLTGKRIDVPMMTQFGMFSYGYNDTMEIEILGMPYAGEVISMYVFLPYTAEPSSFARMVNDLNSVNVDLMLSSMFKTQMHAFIPKFSLDTVLEDELIKGLLSMGLRDPFTETRANFTDFSFDLDLTLDRGIHKAFIDVNEEGTEAAAATAFIANKIGGNSMFVCDRPFVFVIRDDQTKNILFMGAFKSPPVPKADKVPSIPSDPLRAASPHASESNQNINNNQEPKIIQNPINHQGSGINEGSSDNQGPKIIQNPINMQDSRDDQDPIDTHVPRVTEDTQFRPLNTDGNTWGVKG